MGIHSAVASVENINNILIDDVLYDCRMSHALERRLQLNQPVPDWSPEPMHVRIMCPLPMPIQIPHYQQGMPEYNSAPPTISGQSTAWESLSSIPYRSISTDTYLLQPILEQGYPQQHQMTPSARDVGTYEGGPLPHLQQIYFTPQRP